MGDGEGVGVAESGGVGEGVGVGEAVGVDLVCASAETMSMNNKKTDTKAFLIIVEFHFLTDVMRSEISYSTEE